MNVDARHTDLVVSLSNAITKSNQEWWPPLSPAQADEDGGQIPAETPEQRAAVVLDNLQSDVARILANSLRPENVPAMLGYFEAALRYAQRTPTLNA